MKTKIKSILSLFLMAGLLLFNSCAKDGETGPTGATGAAGADGNANVKSFKFTVTNSQWTILASDTWQYFYSCPAVTQDILDNGMVIVYWDANNLSVAHPTNYVPLPIVPFQISTRVLSTSWQLNTLGNGTVTIGISDGAAVPITAQSDLQFKIVVVDGTARKANPGLNWNNYDAVKSALDLKE